MAIDTLLFDCDNTLVLSEHLAFEGCAELVNSLIKAHALPLEPFTGPTLQQKYVGQNFRGMLSSLASEYSLPITQEELEVYVKKEEEVVIAKLQAALEPCEGVKPVLDDLERSGKYTLAVVSSSALRRVNVSLEKTGLAGYFGDRVYSAATSMPEPSSKPDPAIYIFALAKLGKNADTAVAVEDSKSGTTSAVRAGIRTIGYLGAYPPEEREDMGRVLKEAGAVVNINHWDEFKDALKKL